MIRRRGWTLGLAVLALGLLVAAVARTKTALPPPGELERRCAASHPSWQDYDEDIKAQIGAGPAAQWAGAPLEASRQGAAIRVTWRLEGPWAERACGIPILVREPYGAVIQNVALEPQGNLTVYVYELPADIREAALPWIEVKSPVGEQRIVLDPKGEWKAQQTFSE